MHLDDPWWAAISAWVIANPDKSSLWQKGVLRIIGTIAGCILGYELSTQLEGKPIAQAICFFFLGPSRHTCGSGADSDTRGSLGSSRPPPHESQLERTAIALLFCALPSLRDHLWRGQRHPCDGILRLILRLEGVPTFAGAAKKPASSGNRKEIRASPSWAG